MNGQFQTRIGTEVNAKFGESVVTGILVSEDDSRINIRVDSRNEIVSVPKDAALIWYKVS